MNEAISIFFLFINLFIFAIFLYSCFSLSIRYDTDHQRAIKGNITYDEQKRWNRSRYFARFISFSSWALWALAEVLLLQSLFPGSNSPLRDLFAEHLRSIGCEDTLYHLLYTTLAAWTLCLIILWRKGSQLVLPVLGLNPHRVSHRIFLFPLIATLFGYICTRHETIFKQTGGALEDLNYLLGNLFLTLILIVFSLLSVGFLNTRNWTATKERLNLHRKPSWNALGMVIGVVCAYLIAQTAFNYLVGTTGLVNFDDVPSYLQVWWLVVLTSILQPLGEEFFFRGLVQPKMGILLTSAWFAIFHFEYNWYSILLVFLASLSFGWLARRYGLWAAITAHILYNMLPLVPQLIESLS